MPHRHLQTSLLNRRDTVSAGSIGLVGMSLPRLMETQARANEKVAASPPAKACILLIMWGGPGHQDTWDLKPDAPAEVRGESKPISTSVPEYLHSIFICQTVAARGSACLALPPEPARAFAGKPSNERSAGTSDVRCREKLWRSTGIPR